MRWKQIITEDQPRRKHDESITKWIAAAKARPDADELYIHGSRHLFSHFTDPDTSIGKLIFASKLTKESHPRYQDEAYQAEYYGPYLYLAKIHFKKMFRPYSDPKSKEIMTAALFHQKDSPVWDFEEKIKWGRLDYQDLHLVVPPAVAAGYDLFRVYEVSISGESYGAIKGSMIEIVDRLD